MKTLIVEDKEYIRKGLLKLLQTVDANIKVIGECEKVADSVIVAHACQPELIFLDIKLSDGTAFDFLDQTKNLAYKVIFITGYEEYALKALKMGAVDYLLKPIDLDELKTALQKVYKYSLETHKKQLDTVKHALSNTKNTLVLSFQNSLQIVELKELMYCETEKGYTTFYLSDGKNHMASKSLKEFENQLGQNDFIRTHQSFMVNLKYIDKYDKSGTIHLKNGDKIPVSIRKKESFLNQLLNKF
jgi:two-component system LytT family response regulator